MLSDAKKLTSETIVCLVVKWPEARKVCGVVEVKRRDWKCRVWERYLCRHLKSSGHGPARRLLNLAGARRVSGHVE